MSSSVRALNQAKQGSKPLSKGDVAYFETWLAKYRATSSQTIPLVAKTCKAVTTGKEVIFREGTELPKDILEIKEEDVSVTKEECEGTDKELDSEEDESMDHDVISSTASCPLDVSAQEDFQENMPQPCSEVPEQGYCDPKIVKEIFCKEEKNEGPLVHVEGSVSGIGISEVVGNSIEEASPKSVKGIPVFLDELTMT
ncbi:hypothetical protein U1Q18_003393 [Sarracenia purpurea var. burkii]